MPWRADRTRLTLPTRGLSAQVRTATQRIGMREPGLERLERFGMSRRMRPTSYAHRRRCPMAPAPAIHRLNHGGVEHVV
jgi:hypothetical protein